MGASAIAGSDVQGTVTSGVSYTVNVVMDTVKFLFWLPVFVLIILPNPIPLMQNYYMGTWILTSS